MRIAVCGIVIEGAIACGLVSRVGLGDWGIGVLRGGEVECVKMMNSWTGLLYPCGAIATQEQ